MLPDQQPGSKPSPAGDCGACTHPHRVSRETRSRGWPLLCTCSRSRAWYPDVSRETRRLYRMQRLSRAKWALQMACESFSAAWSAAHGAATAALRRHLVNAISPAPPHASGLLRGEASVAWIGTRCGSRADVSRGPPNREPRRKPVWFGNSRMRQDQEGARHAGHVFHVKQCRRPSLTASIPFELHLNRSRTGVRQTTVRSAVPSNVAGAMHHSVRGRSAGDWFAPHVPLRSTRHTPVTDGIARHRHVNIPQGMVEWTVGPGPTGAPAATRRYARSLWITVDNSLASILGCRARNPAPGSENRGNTAFSSRSYSIQVEREVPCFDRGLYTGVWTTRAE